MGNGINLAVVYLFTYGGISFFYGWFLFWLSFFNGYLRSFAILLLVLGNTVGVPLRVHLLITVIRCFKDIFFISHLIISLLLSKKASLLK